MRASLRTGPLEDVLLHLGKDLDEADVGLLTQGVLQGSLRDQVGLVEHDENGEGFGQVVVQLLYPGLYLLYWLLGLVWGVQHDDGRIGISVVGWVDALVLLLAQCVPDFELALLRLLIVHYCGFSVAAHLSWPVDALVEHPEAVPLRNRGLSDAGVAHNEYFGFGGYLYLWSINLLLSHNRLLRYGHWNLLLDWLFGRLIFAEKASEELRDLFGDRGTFVLLEELLLLLKPYLVLVLLLLQYRYLLPVDLLDIGAVGSMTLVEAFVTFPSIIRKKDNLIKIVIAVDVYWVVHEGEGGLRAVDQGAPAIKQLLSQRHIIHFTRIFFYSKLWSENVESWLRIIHEALVGVRIVHLEECILHPIAKVVLWSLQPI